MIVSRSPVLYHTHESLEQIAPAVMASLEKDVFKQPAARVWEETRRYFLANNPTEVERAEREPKHRMALVFRWYLGLSSHWAIDGDCARRVDYQIWCGPAMGAFNAWAAGSFLGPLENRTVSEIGLNLLYGAAALSRAQQLRAAGFQVPQRLFSYAPRRLESRLHSTHGPGSVRAGCECFLTATQTIFRPCCAAARALR